MNSTFSVAVLSDLHFAVPDKAGGKTHAVVGGNSAPNQHPPSDLLSLIKSEGLRADLVMSPGDLTLASCGVGLETAWQHLHDIKRELHAQHVLASTGNHDIESMDVKGAPEIWERLKKLSPLYPSTACDELQRLSYWAEHFCILSVGWLRIVVLNSCNCHSRGDAEFKNGRVTEYTVQMLIKALGSQPSCDLNILLCHHHPVLLPELSDKQPDYSEMKHGAKLIEELENTGQSWLIVHGHKHVPRVAFAGGGTNSPIIFSAGSYSAQLSTQFFPTATNQFYILDFDRADVRAHGACGIVRAWDWANGIGWVKAAQYDGIRRDRMLYGSGFGCRVPALQIANQIDALVESGKASWEWVLENVKGLQYQRVADRINTLKQLTQQGLHASSPDPLNPVEVVRGQK